MKSVLGPDQSDLEDKTFVLLLIAVTLAFALILWQFFGAVLWGVVLAIVFEPLYERLCKSMKQRRTLAALAAVTIIVVMVILPLALIVVSLVNEASGVYKKIQSGELDFGQYFRQIIDALPAWVTNLLDHLGLKNVSSLQERLAPTLAKGSQFLINGAFNIGQSTFDFVVSLFVMLYLLFFLFRDGADLARRIKDKIPLRPQQQHILEKRFTGVIRATVKGNVVVAILHGALGGLIFWFLGIRAALLWGILMAMLSLVPAVGPPLIWLPVAIYFLTTGAVWRGLILLTYGILAVCLVDYFVRPILVGKGTKMPDYVVLISTFGGIAVFGINGFVIGPMIAAMFMAVWDIFPSHDQA